MLDVCQRQLERLYTNISEDRARCFAIRQWCVTVWLGTLAALASGKLSITIRQALFLTIASVVMFWILDGFQHVFVRINSTRARELEAILANPSTIDTFGLRHFCVSGYKEIAYRTKMRHFVRTLFLNETVFFFYLLLLVGSLTFVFLLGIPASTGGN